jgi:hypothetical protein
VIQLWSSRLASYLVATAFVFPLTLCVSGASAASSIPASWTCSGSCGSSGAHGVVPLSPAGNPAYEWISTNGGVFGVGALAGVSGVGCRGSSINGSTLQTNTFTVSAGSLLNFYFNYTTTDGALVSGYDWAELFNSADVPVALLATARTPPGGNTIPGSNMPVPVGTLTPAMIPIQPGRTMWSPLGSFAAPRDGWIPASRLAPPATTFCYSGSATGTTSFLILGWPSMALPWTANQSPPALRNQRACFFLALALCQCC